MAREAVRSDAVVERFLALIAPIVDRVERIYLFGSRCRDDWRPDSDYDILIVLTIRDRAVVDRLYDAVMDVLLETGKLVSLKIYARSEFERLASIPTPFMEKVLTEGVQLGR